MFFNFFLIIFLIIFFFLDISPFKIKIEKYEKINKTIVKISKNFNGKKVDFQFDVCLYFKIENEEKNNKIKAYIKNFQVSEIYKEIYSKNEIKLIEKNFQRKIFLKI